MDESWPQQMRKGFAELCVLVVLKRGESYGYAILAELSAIHALAFSESTLYPMLSKMADEGVLKTREGPSLRGKSRRYYSLTAKGRNRLNDLMIYWKALRDGIDALVEKRGTP